MLVKIFKFSYKVHEYVHLVCSLLNHDTLQTTGVQSSKYYNSKEYFQWYGSNCILVMQNLIDHVECFLHIILILQIDIYVQWQKDTNS